MMKDSWVCAAWIHVYFSFVIVLLVLCALLSASFEDSCRWRRKRREDVFLLEYGHYGSAFIGVIEEQANYSLESSLDPVCSFVSWVSAYLAFILVLVRFCLLGFWFTVSLHQLVSVFLLISFVTERCPWIMGTHVATICIGWLGKSMYNIRFSKFIFHISSLLSYAALKQHMVHNSLKRHIAILCWETNKCSLALF